MNKAISTIGLLAVLLTLIIGLRFITGESAERPPKRSYAQEQTAEKEAENDAKKSKPQPDETQKIDFREINRFARRASHTDGSNLKEMAQHLASVGNTDREKARAIYVWLTKNIRYDDDAYNSEQSGAYKAKDVFRERTAVCEGFSNLFLAMGEEVGLEIKKVIGYSKGASYVPGSRLEESDHAWNIIKIDGAWRVFDATWGEGGGDFVTGQLVSKKEFNDYWFNVDPYEAIFNHFPEDESLTFVEPAISLFDYEQLPYIRSAFFKLGFDGKEAFQIALEDPDYDFPFCFDFKAKVKVINAPIHKYLEVGKTYSFQFESPNANAMAAILTETDWNSFKKEGNQFKLRYTVKKTGDLSIGIQE
ncbi:MAG: transglutaminase domain-containing protein, partial [Bacteroidota bacterium]